MGMAVMMMAVYKRGNRWGVDICFPDGRRLRKIIGSKKRAEAIEAKLKQEILDQKWQFRFLPEIRFNEFLKRYLVYVEKTQSISTFKSNSSRIRKNILPYFRKIPLLMISKERLDNYKLFRQKQGAKPNTVRNELVNLSHMFKMAMRWGYVYSNPVSGIEKPRVSKLPPRYLTSEEANRLLKACSPHLYPIVLCALHTGMRKSELLNLRWPEIDLQKRQITITSNEDYHTKNYDYRHVGINDTLFVVLSQLNRQSEYDFTYRGQRIKDIKKSLQAAYKKAGLPYGGLHICRHTFASNLIKKGVELEKIQKLLGHQDFSTTLQYAHLSSRSVKDEVNKLDREDKDE